MGLRSSFFDGSCNELLRSNWALQNLHVEVDDHALAIDEVAVFLVQLLFKFWKFGTSLRFEFLQTLSVVASSSAASFELNFFSALIPLD